VVSDWLDALPAVAVPYDERLVDDEVVGVVEPVAVELVAVDPLVAVALLVVVFAAAAMPPVSAAIAAMLRQPATRRAARAGCRRLRRGGVFATATPRSGGRVQPRCPA
jgi:hypothetical protein